MVDWIRPSFENSSKWEIENCPLYHKNPWINSPNLKERAEKHLKEANLDSDLNNYEWIKLKFEKYYWIFNQLALEISRYLAIGLGKKDNYFDPWFKNECTSTYRVLHYLPRDQTEVGRASTIQTKLVTPEHCDTSFLTLLSTFENHGL